MIETLEIILQALDDEKLDIREQVKNIQEFTETDLFEINNTKGVDNIKKELLQLRIKETILILQRANEHMEIVKNSLLQILEWLDVAEPICSLNSIPDFNIINLSDNVHMILPRTMSTLKIGDLISLSLESDKHTLYKVTKMDEQGIHATLFKNTNLFSNEHVIFKFLKHKNGKIVTKCFDAKTNQVVCSF